MLQAKKVITGWKSLVDGHLYSYVKFLSWCKTFYQVSTVADLEVSTAKR